MGHFVSQTTLGVKRPMSLVVEERSSSDQISNFEVDLSEDVTGLVPLQIFKGIIDESHPPSIFPREKSREDLGFLRRPIGPSRLSPKGALTLCKRSLHMETLHLCDSLPNKYRIRQYLIWEVNVKNVKSMV